MGLFDSLKQMATGELGSAGPGLLEEALGNTPFGGASGLVEHLAQSGLGPEIEAMASGQPGAGISPDALRGVLNDDHVQQLASQFGVQPDQVFGLLSQHLPGLLGGQAQEGEDGQD